jgi:uncharacterized protein YidB (DUF937 family)
VEIIENLKNLATKAVGANPMVGAAEYTEKLGGASALLSAMGSYVDAQGGVAALLEKFKQNGFGNVVSSWLSTGANEAISPENVSKVMGTEASEKISHFLPIIIDKLSPNGSLVSNQVSKSELSGLDVSNLTGR